ncbi:MAG: methyltransferase domain-containing protein [Rhodospirillales bacterium]|nr:methyltransferase domain-containing protein [Rhodospirillales bacterium]
MSNGTDERSSDAHRDRVSQVYFAMIERGVSAEVLRRRIDWMVDQTRGSRVLDVGCSEGALEILLARKEFDVTGVDINVEALAFARKLLERESEEVRARVRFVQGDLAHSRLLDDRFDTLVMGEVLEHLKDPKALLHRSLELIRPGGRVIITTPFGYHPDEDHRQTFCLSEFCDLVKPCCALESLQIVDGYIRMVGRASSSMQESWERLTADELLGMTETALVSSQQRLYGDVERHKGRVGALEERGQKLTVKATALAKNVEQGRSRTRELQLQLEGAETKASDLQRKVEVERDKATRLRGSIRWQLGTLIVDAARSPWKTIHLPIDVARLSLAAARRRNGPAINVSFSSERFRPAPATGARHVNTPASPTHAKNSSGIRNAGSPLGLTSSGDRAIDWITDRVEGQSVAVVGDCDVQLLASLDRLRFNVITYRHDSAVLLPADIDAQTDAGSQRKLDNSSSTGGLAAEDEIATGSSRKTDTVIVFGMPQKKNASKTLLDSIRAELSRSHTRLIIFQPRFSAVSSSENDFDLTSLMEWLRKSTVPVSLSLAEEDLRFVGQFDRPSPGSWSQFEAGIWAQLLHDVADSVQSGHSREVRVLEQRVHNLLDSTSYKAGQVLVAAAKEPRTLWKVPFQLWRMYRSTRSPRLTREQELLFRSGGPPITFPELAMPTPHISGAPVVAAILDTFTEHCFRYEMDLVLLEPKRWRLDLERARPQVLLVESAWSGNNGAWRHLIADFTQRNANPLRELLSYCRDNGIPTVFWNKEDPPNFEVFIDAAKEFDFVFTTDANCIPAYRQLCGHDRIYLMPFASQPRIHNPFRKSSWPRYSVCFAGSWMEKYPHRNNRLHDLLEPALVFGLHIFDRNFNRPGYSSSKYRFPDRYLPAIKGSLDYKQMLTAYRCYDVMLNVNSVTDSPTMFSRRVYESLACGTPVISADSEGLRAVLGEYARIAHCSQDTAGHLKELLADEELRMREGHLGYRHVHQHHTYRHRIEEMFARVGVVPAMSMQQPSVSVVMTRCRPENVNQAIANYEKQNYQEKELLLLLDNSAIDVDSIEAEIERLDNVRILRLEGRQSRFEALIRGSESASGDYVANMYADVHYGKNYLSDLMLASGFSQAEVLGKGTYFIYSEDQDFMALRSVRGYHEFTDFVSDATLIVRRDVLKECHFSDRAGKEYEGMLTEMVRTGCRIYSADPFSVLLVRRANDRDSAAETEDGEFLQDCRNVQTGLEWERVMI